MGIQASFIASSSADADYSHTVAHDLTWVGIGQRHACHMERHMSSSPPVPLSPLTEEMQVLQVCPLLKLFKNLSKINKINQDQVEIRPTLGITKHRILC